MGKIHPQQPERPSNREPGYLASIMETRLKELKVTLSPMKGTSPTRVAEAEMLRAQRLEPLIENLIEIWYQGPQCHSPQELRFVSNRYEEVLWRIKQLAEVDQEHLWFAHRRDETDNLLWRAYIYRRPITSKPLDTNGTFNDLVDFVKNQPGEMEKQSSEMSSEKLDENSMMSLLGVDLKLYLSRTLSCIGLFFIFLKGTPVVLSLLFTLFFPGFTSSGIGRTSVSDNTPKLNFDGGSFEPTPARPLSENELPGIETGGPDTRDRIAPLPPNSQPSVESESHSTEAAQPTVEPVKPNK